MDKPTTDNLIVETSIAELGASVPMKVLHELIEDAVGKQDAQKPTDKKALLNNIKELVHKDIISVKTVLQLIQDYKYAGRVSICWGIPFQWTSLSKTKLQEIILEKSNVNPFEKEIKPKLIPRPSFNRAEWLAEDLLRLEFVYAGKSYEVEDNYQKRIIVPTKRIGCYIRLEEKTFVVETRASIQASKKIYDALSRLLDIDIVSMTFSNQDIQVLKQKLNDKSTATKKAAKHKRYGGDLDMVSVSASPAIDDLDSSDEYNSKFADGELKEVRFRLIHITDSKQKIDASLHISNQGNIWFMSDVPEEIIEYVFAIVRKIKFLPPVKKLGLSSKISKDEEGEIQKLITSIREHGYGNRFHPRIYQTLGIEIEEKKWIETISKLVRLGHIKERFELVCPVCYETIQVYADYNDIPLEEENACNACNYKFEVSEKDILLTYSFKANTQLNKDTSLSEEKVYLASNTN